MDVAKYFLILSGILIRSIYRSFFRLPKRLLPRSVLLLLALSTQASSIVVDSAGAGFPGLFENERSTAYVNLSSDHELDQLLGYVVTQFPDHIIRYITKATDLQEGGLETRLFLDDQGNVSAPAPGMMFNDRAVILVVDYRQMTATQVAELNGILDSVRTYNGKRLSNTTRILAVADESVLSAAWSADAPGSDFWRRVNNIGQAPDISLLRKQASHCVPTLEQYVRRHVWDSIPFDVSHLPAKTLDFASGLSAGDVLSGGIELDSGGGLIFRDAALGDFGDALFILKDAPWEDIAFKVQLANTLASRGMDSGDQCLALPARFFLQRKDTSPGVMAQTLEAFGKRHQDAETRWFPLNSVNFDLVFSEMALRKGQLVKSGVGGNLKQNFQGIEVTSTLTNHQWKRLTGLLSAGGQLENLTLRVREKEQPVVVPDNLFQRQEEAVNGSLVQRLSGTLSLEKIREEHPGAHIEVVSPSLDASQLLETIRMESRQNRRFQRHSTDFYKALQTPARQIIITGLESNPDIQKLLEPLLSGTPSVPRFGQLSLINSQPDIRVQWLEPGLAVTSSWSEWLSHNPEHDEAAPSVSSPSEPVHVNWNRPEQLVKTVSEAIQNHALVYLEGPPGSGKSYTASRVAKKLAGQQTVYQLTTGPTSRRQDLFGDQVLRPLPDYPDDSETLFVEGPILRWAQQRSKNGEPVILVLDEGNLLDKNVQVLLSGVTLQQPFISSNGDAYYLTPEHRLVITGNPLSFEGRYLIPELHNHAKTIRFAAMDSGGLSGQVIAPFLEVMDSERCQRDECDWIGDLLLDNLAGYQGQLTGYSFSARDTLDVLSRFQFYLGDLAQKSTHEIENTLKQALHDSFSGLLAGQKRSVGLSSRAYYVKHHAFDAFYERLKHQSTSLNLENDSTRTLARRIWLELERVAGENNHHRSHPGRHGMMIEGPAGRGKDVVLDIVMKQWREDWALKGLILPPPLCITAGYNNWDRLKALIIRAKTEGRILIVSELNLLPTHFLEGVLNDVLSGEAAPGFFLIATVNPVQYSGRHAFSSALASRFTQLILDEYTLNDFKVIAASYTDSSFSDDIALWHHKRVETLKQNKALAVPAVMMMIEYLKALDKSEVVNPNALRNRFMTFYRLYLKDGWRPEPVVVPVEADVVKILEKELAPVPETSLMTKLFSLVVGESETKEAEEEAGEQAPVPASERSLMAKWFSPFAGESETKEAEEEAGKQAPVPASERSLMAKWFSPFADESETKEAEEEAGEQAPVPASERSLMAKWFSPFVGESETKEAEEEAGEQAPVPASERSLMAKWFSPFVGESETKEAEEEAGEQAPVPASERSLMAKWFSPFAGESETKEAEEEAGEQAPVPASERSLMAKWFSPFVGESETKEAEEEAGEQAPVPASERSPMTKWFSPFAGEPEAKEAKEEITGGQTLDASDNSLNKFDEKEIAGIPEEGHGNMQAAFDVDGHTDWAATQDDAAKEAHDDEKNIDGNFDDQGTTYRFNKRFSSNFSPMYYRLDIKWLKIYNNGEVKLVPFPTGELTPYPHFVQADLSKSLLPGQHHGTQDVIKRGTLTSLFPHEKLVAIWTEENTDQPVEVQYDAYRGIYTVNLPESDGSSTTRIHYVVEEDKTVNRVESLESDEVYQAPLLWIHRLNLLMSKSPLLAAELGHNDKLSQKQRVEKIIAYSKSFTAPDRAMTSLINRESDIELMAELIERRIGTCRHISFAVAGLMQFYGIPVRVMINEAHGWVEYSLNNGKTWQALKIKGTYGDYEVVKQKSSAEIKKEEVREEANKAISQEPVRSDIAIQQLFYHEHSPERYRQSVQYMRIDAYGAVRFIDMPYRGIRIPELPSDIEGQQLSNHDAVRGEQVVKTGERTPLASLSPREKLLALSSEGITSEQILVEYDAFQGLYFVTVNKQEGGTEEVTLHFLIQPGELPFPRDSLMTDKQKPELMSEKHRRQVDAFFAAHPDIFKKIDIQPEMARSRKIEKIVSFVRQFGPARPESEDVSLTMLLQQMEYGQGDCRYRSYIAAMLAEYYKTGVARVVSNDVNTFVEFSPDGVNWEGHDLKGYKYSKYKKLAAGTELLKTGWDSLKEIPSVKEKKIYEKQDLNKDALFFLRPYALGHVIKDFHKLKSETRKKVLSYFKNLLLYFNADPSRMKDIPYLLLDDPEVYQKLSPWLNRQLQNLQQVHLISKNSPAVKDITTAGKSIDELSADEIKEPLLRTFAFINNEVTVNDYLDGSPFTELEQLLKKKTPNLKKVWKYQPPGQLQVSRLLENKAAFAHTSEHQELQQNRLVIFNVGSPLLDSETMERYQIILGQKLEKEHRLNFDMINLLVKQSLFDAIYHLNRLTGQRSGVLRRYESRDGTYGFRLYKPYPDSEMEGASWLWTQTIKILRGNDQAPDSETVVLRSSFPLPVNQLPEEWQDAVIVDDDMLDRLLTRYLESLSREQVDNLRKALQSPVQ
ncbi:AAA family ATPase [Endozoicomonas euniceicola]|uniref:AAA family ATPase n=1 Tax=Endozoicomonas euniceicola TaxID=1234143 RepID=A0ABY6GX76_9GAMM|nr:AAA family ATPase [Endozoicomonas euniceicola]UYM17384.1 AAA family ATPase [Endozoicomonas euniceicola]